MPKFISKFTATTFLTLTATGAMADVTPQQVWDAMKVQFSLSGELTAVETQTGDTLDVSQITLSNSANGAQSDVTIGGTISFRNLGDGTVAVEYPSTMTFQSTSDAGQASATIGMELVQSGGQMRASGTPDNIRFDFSFPTMVGKLTEIDVDGETFEGDFVVTASAMNGYWTQSGDGNRQVNADYSMASMNVDADFDMPDEEGRIDFQIEMSDLGATSNTRFPADFDASTPETLFQSDFQVAADLEFQATEFTVRVDAPDQTTNIAGTLGGGSFGVGMSPDGIRYAVTNSDFQAEGGIVGLPIPPVAVTFAQSGFDLIMPLGQSETPQDFKLATLLKDLKVSDFLWAMVDPMQQLPRDAATVNLDITGKANWAVDLFDPMAMAAAEDGVGTLDSLQLNDLTVKIAGAELNGAGAFTFDNDDLETFDGIPRPIGAIDLALTGGITLLDTLTSMGLVPQEQAMGIKMMSGLFAVPGDGPDTLNSKIEIDESGAILANGQRIQ